jgi:aminodeoxyfutalosine synthase
MKLAQVALSYGVDDLDGTVIEEKIYHMAGAQTPQQVARDELVKAIREAGREPVQRDSLYRRVGVSVSERVDEMVVTKSPVTNLPNSEGGVA